MKTPLRVGVLVDDLTVPAWAYAMLRRIQQSEYAVVGLFILNDTPSPQTERSWLKTLKHYRGAVASRGYKKCLWALQRALMEYKPASPDAFEPKALFPTFSGTPVLRVAPIQRKVSDSFRDDDLTRIAAYHPDVLVRLGFRILRGKILTAVRYGVWSYHHGDNTINRGGPPGFWEVMESWPETGSLLQILTEDLDNGQVLYRSSARTREYSVRCNRNAYYWKSAAFLPRKLEELSRLGEEIFFDNVSQENIHPTFYSNRLFVQPTNSELTGLLTRKLLQKIWWRMQKIFYIEQWAILFSVKPDVSSSFWRFKKILPPKDRFWADPHVVARNDTYYIFLEEYLYHRKKGHIAVMTLDRDGKYTAPVPVIEKPYHLSYPFVFQWDNTYYMIPETTANRTIELYRCVEFPDTWQFEMNLMEEVAAVDATLFQAQGKWWLFVNIVEYEGASSCDELFLFYADTPLTRDWHAHPANPVVSDVASSRPAGRLFRRNGKLYRPSQKGAPRYGYGMNIQEITLLSKTQYQETTIASIEPNWDRRLIGTHTLTHERHLTMIDGLYRRSRWW